MTETRATFSLSWVASMDRPERIVMQMQPDGTIIYPDRLKPEELIGLSTRVKGESETDMLVRALMLLAHEVGRLKERVRDIEEIGGFK